MRQLATTVGAAPGHSTSEMDSRQGITATRAADSQSLRKASRPPQTRSLHAASLFPACNDLRPIRGASSRCAADALARGHNSMAGLEYRTHTRTLTVQDSGSCRTLTNEAHRSSLAAICTASRAGLLFLRVTRLPGRAAQPRPSISWARFLPKASLSRP